MILKSGVIMQDGGGEEDAIWEYEKDGRVLIMTNDNYLVVSIDVEDFLGIAAAIKETQNGNHNKRDSI